MKLIGLAFDPMQLQVVIWQTLMEALAGPVARLQHEMAEQEPQGLEPPIEEVASQDRGGYEE